MNIKQYIIGGLMGAALIGAPSCSSDFLDETLDTKFSTEYFDTPEGLEALTISLYGHLCWRFAYDHANAPTLLGTDEWIEGNSWDNELWGSYNINLNPSAPTKNSNTATPASWWDAMYFGVAAANTIIDRADKIDNETVRNNCLAHAYLSRGLDFYTLAVQYGGIVLQTEPAAGVVRTFTRATEEETWEQVISDFRNAYELFTGETDTFGFGKGVAWKKSTAAHWLAKALLWRASERNSAWNAAYIDEDLKEAVAAASYAIQTHSLEQEYNDLYNNWTGIDCAIEQSDEILMAAPFNDSSTRRSGYGNASLHMFSCQFSNFSGGFVARGMVTGGKDFQRCLPTEYTMTVYDHVNDSRLWKSFRTVWGVNAKTAQEAPKSENYPTDEAYQEAVDQYNRDMAVNFGDPAIVFILNTADDHTYDDYTFGTYSQNPTFIDEAGRLPEWSKDARQTPTSGELSGRTSPWIPNSSVLYQNGKYVAYDFRTAGNARCNMLPSLCKTVSGAVSADGNQDGFRDVTMARLGETYLVRAECYARQGNYAQAMADINVIRARAGWKAGENRSYFVDGCDAFVNNAGYSTRVDLYENTSLNMNTYYLSNPTLEVTTEATDITLKSFPGNLPAEDEAILTKLGVSGDKDRAINFILNEKTRECAGEWFRWEDLARTKTLEKRYNTYNPDGKQYNNFDPNKHYLRPIPQSFIDGLLHEDGTNLTDAEKAAWQNPGY